MTQGTNQNQVGKTNGSEEIRPCLIDGFHALTDIHPPYYNPLRVDSQTVASIDAVRIALNLDGDGMRWFMDNADRFGGLFGTDEVDAWTSKISIGKYHTVWNYNMGESSLTLGVGFFDKSCKLNERKAFAEFNPNKTAGDERFSVMMSAISSHVLQASMRRYDLALDVALDRSACRLSKDRRIYQSWISNGITESLGVRNTAGHVRVYDKAAESGLNGSLTRIELTCDGDWTADDVASHWPEVHSWTVPEATRDWVRVVGMLLSEKAERGEDIETYIAMLGRGSRPKVRSCLRSSVVGLPDCAARYAVEQSMSWSNLFAH